MRILTLLFYVCIRSSGGDEELNQLENRKNLFEHLSKARTVLFEDFNLVERQFAIEIFQFKSYSSVSVVHYSMAVDLAEARFTFQTEDIHRNVIGSCSPQKVIIHIKHGSYPAVNPDGYDFPKHFVDPGRREQIHTLHMMSNGINTSYVIHKPKPGTWFALIYIEWEDPLKEKVTQQGLSPNCQTLIYSDLQVKCERNIEIIDCYNDEITIDYESLPAQFKCMSLDSVEAITFRLTVTNTDINSEDMFLRIGALTIPTEGDNLLNCNFNPRQNYNQNIEFIPYPSAWHYIKIDHIAENASEIANCESYNLRIGARDFIKHTIRDLMRDDKGRFFTYNYALATSDAKQANSLVNITTSETLSLRFLVNQLLDIGGCMLIKARLLINGKLLNDIQRASFLKFNEYYQLLSIVICMDVGHPSVPLETGHCRFNDKVKPALFVLNNTNSKTISDKTFIPFPDSGMWYLSVSLFCNKVECPCMTDNETKPLESDIVSVDGTEFESECTTTVVLTVSSTYCVNGKCGGHGSCQLNAYGGPVMSYCSCIPGYGSWDCSNDSRKESKRCILTAVLLLTLSNLFFILSIYAAIIRYYFTEATMYTFTMVFSTFYHACNAPPDVAYCITRSHILQFGDFYCAIMSFWVTALAMSIISDQCRSSLLLTGAVIIALLVIKNMYSIISFATPIVGGFVVLLASWGLDYAVNRRMKYSKTYYIIYMPLGLLLVGTGGICYSFLQTVHNYKIVHSIWHIAVALSVTLMLPDSRRDGKLNPFVPSPDFWKVNFRNLFRRSEPSE